MRLLVAALVLALAACGGADSDVAQPGPQLYEASATVLEAAPGRPMLCVGAIAESLPPQCGDVPISGWDWDAVDGGERHGGTMWGSYRVVGTYDLETFTVVEVGPPEDGTGRSTDVDFSSPCPGPESDKDASDPARSSEERVGRAEAYAGGQPDYVGSWVTHLGDRGEVVFNGVFTGDAERHEAELRTVWGGPLCVVERDAPTERERHRIADEIQAGSEELGLDLLWASAGGVDPVVEVGVVADPGGEAQAALDARYGPGAVRLVPALTPVE